MRLASLKISALALLCALPAMAAPSARPNVRAALGRTALALLVEAGANSNPEVRAAAAAAWGKIGNPAALPVLKKMAKDREESVRLAAAQSLYSLGDKAAFPIILDIAKAQPQEPANPTPIDQLKLMVKERLRIDAINELRSIGKADPKLGVKAVKAFETTLDDPYGPVRDATAIALAAMGLDEFTPRFLNAAQSQNSGVRVTAIRALGQIGTPAAVEAVSTATADSSADVRSEAMAAAARFPAADAVPFLEKGLKDSDPGVRAQALQALAGFDDERSSASVRQAFDSAPDLSTEMVAMAGLLRRGQKVDLSAVIPALKNSDEDIRRLGIDVLALYPGGESLALLKTEIETDDSTLLKVAAAQAALVRLESKRSKKR